MVASLVGSSPANAAVTTTLISDATFPLGLDVDSDGNTWIGYAEGPMTPKGVTVVPAASGTLFGVSVTAGVGRRIFDLNGVQGVLRAPNGHLFVSAGGHLYVATATNTNVFGVATTANTLTQLSTSGGGCAICAGHIDGGLAMDSTGNLFGGRKAANGIGVVPVAGGTLYGVNVLANRSRVLSNAPEWTGDVAMDRFDNLYVGSWFGGAPGVYVLPKSTSILYGQSVTQDLLTRLVNTSVVSGIDIDSADNIYFARWSTDTITVLTPTTRTVLGQSFTAHVPAVLTGAPADQGVAVAADGSFLITGAAQTRRVVGVNSPTITSVSPSSGSPGGGESVTITGTDLTGATSVTFGGVAATNVVVVSGTTVTATVPAGAPGAVNVTVTTPGGTATATGAYTYASPAPPRIPPGPPLNVMASPTLGGATVTWSPPADPGTDDVNLFAVRAWPGGPACQVPGIALSCSVAGLDPELDYYFTVVAMSGAGWGAASQPSNTIRPLAPQPPGAPTDVVATPSDAQVTVTWTVPSSSGSSSIREYRVTSSPAGGSCVSLASPCTVTGLVNGTAYTFTVEARNEQGWGPASQASAAVTPQAPSVTIFAERSGRLMQLTGVTTGIAPGSVVTVWWRFGGQATFAPSAAVVRVDQADSFAWQRRINPAKPFEAYATAGSVQSNSVLVSGGRAR